MVYGRITFTRRVNLVLFNFFNKNDSGFTERMNSNNERLSPWKMRLR